MSKANTSFREKVLDFLGDLVWACKGIPSEALRWWKDAHRWDRDKGEYVIVPDGNHESLIYVPDPDYKMWRTLGWVTDALIAAIGLAVLFLAIVAAMYVVT